MANEAVILELSGQNPLPFSCVADISISKGALLKLSTDLTVWLSSAVDQAYAGVAAADKSVANGDVSTRIAVHVPGQNNVFDMTAAEGAIIAAGAMVKLSGINLISAAVDTDYEDGFVIGQALEASATTEVIRVRS